MKFFILILVVIQFANAFGQTLKECKVEVYLFKPDSNKLDLNNSTPTLHDLEDSALIADQEIIMYSFKKFKETLSTKHKKTRRIHIINTSISLADRIDNSRLQTTGGRKFAIVLNNVIIYWGYLSSTLSSIVPDSGVDARISGNELELNYYSSNPTKHNDPRENKILFACLKLTQRYRYSTRENGR